MFKNVSAAQDVPEGELQIPAAVPQCSGREALKWDISH